MTDTELKIIQTASALIIYIFARVLVQKSVNRNVRKKMIHPTRGRVVRRILNGIFLVLLTSFALLVWGIDRSELLVFTSSVMAFVGIALFAQWSILSNITAGIILFFNHTIKLDDEITVMEKDYEIAGSVTDISLFFVTIKTQTGEEITMPSNMLMQKMVKKTPRQEIL